jgi:hypothetical protein
LIDGVARLDEVIEKGRNRRRNARRARGGYRRGRASAASIYATSADVSPEAGSAQRVEFQRRRTAGARTGAGAMGAPAQVKSSISTPPGLRPTSWFPLLLDAIEPRNNEQSQTCDRPGEIATHPGRVWFFPARFSWFFQTMEVGMGLTGRNAGAQLVLSISTPQELRQENAARKIRYGLSKDQIQ